MMLESPVQRNLHAGFGGGHSKKDRYIPRRVPTLQCIVRRIEKLLLELHNLSFAYSKHKAPREGR
jgi:hypothetical protein